MAGKGLDIMNGLAKILGKGDSKESPAPKTYNSSLPGIEKNIKENTDADKRSLIQKSFNKSLK